MASEIHVDNVGTRFSMTVQETGSGVDISNNSSITIYIKKPDDEVIRT